MKKRKQIELIAVIGLLMPLLCAAAFAAFQKTKKPAATTALLFDGRSFAGWEGDQKIFRIEQGAIVGGTLKNKIARNEFLCTTREYSNFALTLKFKLLGEGANAGVQFRSQRIPNNHEVIGYQADLGDGWWGSLYDESRRNKTIAAPEAERVKAVLKKDDWNDYEIRAEGPRVQLRINNVQTVDYTEQDQTISQTGIICVQIHGGNPSEAWYKEISITELP